MPTLDQFKTQYRNANPTLTKMVDGKSITLTPDEYSKTIDEWAQNSYNQQQAQLIKDNGGASPDYANFRRAAYPSIPDQLDMIYHDSVDGTTTWKDTIAAVKAKYRKP